MRDIFIIAVLLAVGGVLSAQQSGPDAAANASGVAEIKTLEAKLADVIVRADWDEYAKNLGPDYLHVRENGHSENKDEALASLRDVQRKIIFIEIEPADSVTRIYGDTAVSNAEFIFTVRDSGQVKTRHTRVTDVFVKRDGQWNLVSRQETAIGK
jgi:hypothetical protein